MYARLTALAVALAMLAPAAAVAGGLGCEVGAVASAACCCEDAAAPATDGTARIDGTCCCEVREAPARHHVDETAAPAPSSRDLAALAVTAVVAIDAEPRARREGPAVRARGPPPARTLLAQRVSFLC